MGRPFVDRSKAVIVNGEDRPLHQTLKHYTNLNPARTHLIRGKEGRSVLDKPAALKRIPKGARAFLESSDELKRAIENIYRAVAECPLFSVFPDLVFLTAVFPIIERSIL